MPGRSYQDASGYRYGFQGQEADDEIRGKGNSVNYKYRMHDARIGRFFAVDPLAPKYPHYTPYQFSGNKVVAFVELEGLEELSYTIKEASKLFETALEIVKDTEMMKEFDNYFKNHTNSLIFVYDFIHMSTYYTDEFGGDITVDGQVYGEKGTSFSATSMKDVKNMASMYRPLFFFLHYPIIENGETIGYKMQPKKKKMLEDAFAEGKTVGFIALYVFKLNGTFRL